MTTQTTQTTPSTRLRHIERKPPESSRTFEQNRSRGEIWIKPKFRAHLAARGLTDVDAVMRDEDGRLMRRLTDRENWCLELTDGVLCTRAYLKKHRARSLGTWLRAKLGIGPGRTAARVEAEHCTRLAEQGIPTMCVVAFGEELSRGGRLRSFLMTEELTGYAQLDEFLDARFPENASLTDKALRELIEATAEVAGRFHRLGYNHRDFYTCHFFIREPSPGRFRVHMIDLQRVQKRRWLRRRWVVKDLAQLAYSAPEHPIGRRERMLFFKRYLGVSKLRRPHKRLLRSVLARERRMRHKLGPYR